MKRFFLLVIVFQSVVLGMVAQGSVMGVVVDTLGNGVMYANVMLLDGDSVFVGGTVTDSLGLWEMECDGDDGYIVQVSSVGYVTAEVALSEKIIKVVLREDAQMLGEVTLKAKRPVSKITAEGMQTDVAHTVLEDMGSGNDVLKRVPMLRGDDGEYEVLGRGAAKIYINGREVRDASEIERLSSKEIQNVEVISSPGARYDASVTAVVNITTTKKQGDGWSVNARSSFYTWTTQDYMNSVGMNYRKGGLDVFASVDYDNTSGYQIGEHRQTVNIDTLWEQRSMMDGQWSGDNLNATLGLNYEINDNHRLGFRYEIMTRPQGSRMDISQTSDVMADGVEFDKWENEFKQIKKDVPGHKANIYYSGKVEELSIDINADYLGIGGETIDENTEMSQQYGDRVVKSYSTLRNDLWAAKLQMSYPVWKGQFRVGAEYVNVKRDDAYKNETMEDLTSRVDVDEHNVAAFLQYSAQTKGGNFSLGLRYENATYEYKTDGKKNEELSKVYHQLFPSASYSIQLKKVGLQATYKSQVYRPSYGDLSNNMMYANRLTMQTGNTYLQPTVLHNVGLSAVWKFIHANVNYTYRDNAVEFWMDRYDKDPKVTIITRKNIEESHMMSVNLVVAPEVKWWKPQWILSMQKTWVDMEKYGMKGTGGTPIFFASWKNVFDLPHDIIINLDARYTSPGENMFLKVLTHQVVADFSISKSFLKKSLQLKIGIDNIFNNVPTFITTNNNCEVYQRTEFADRQAYITLRYNFNQAKSKYKGSSAGSDAMRRL